MAVKVEQLEEDLKLQSATQGVIAEGYGHVQAGQYEEDNKARKDRHFAAQAE